MTVFLIIKFVKIAILSYIMWLLVNLFLFLHISEISADGVPCTTPDGKQELICNETIDTVCCTEHRNGSSYGAELSDRRYCGYQQFDNYEFTRNDTSIDEFPWLAAILGIELFTENEVVVCHGSLINNRYLLSAAQCFSSGNARRYNITEVLLGEYQRNTSKDCIELPEFQTTDCTEAEQYQIEETIVHPFYLKRHYLADIALIRLDRTVTYTDYIRPICLPIQGIVLAKPGEILYTTGWGRPTVRGEGAIVKKKIATVLISTGECQTRYYEREVLPEISYICSIDFENNTSYSCSGDSGAPVMFQHRNQWHIEGIVSRGTICSNTSPGVHTRVATHLEWIKQNMKL